MLDPEGDLQAAFQGYDVVVDAAGPFQDYGNDPYRVARAALAFGCHYLDLSDDGQFTYGIQKLDTLAQQAGLSVVSGVSSVPALSSAVVSALCVGLDRITRIESAILPGNRAPRGTSVMRAILGQVGAPLPIWRDGRWQTRRGWSEGRSYVLAPGLNRRAALIGAPDLALFPAHFGADTVEFRAGLEIGVMQHSLSALSWLRSNNLCRDLARFTGLFQRLAIAMEHLGSDRGGMVVRVEGDTGQAALRRSWTLLAEAGDGPFIPAIPAQILLGKLAKGQLPAGARPALEVFTLDDAEQALAQLRVTTSIQEEVLHHGDGGTVQGAATGPDPDPTRP